MEEQNKNTMKTFLQIHLVVLIVNTLVLVAIFSGGDLLSIGNGGYDEYKPSVDSGADSGAGSGADSGADSGARVIEVLSVKDGEPVSGNKNSEILLVEYSDFECPFCSSFHPTAKRAVDELGIAWVYRHFPLSFHQTAEEGSIIAECVKDNLGNDEFLSFVDGVFENGTGNLDLYKSLGKREGLSDLQINTCLASDEYKSRVQNSLKEGSGIGVRGTPGAFIINRSTNKVAEVPGAVGFDTLRGIIDSVK